MGRQGKIGRQGKMGRQGKDGEAGGRWASPLLHVVKQYQALLSTWLLGNSGLLNADQLHNYQYLHSKCLMMRI